jgi:outer membrane receptor for ferrienterochelin and colicin
MINLKNQNYYVNTVYNDMISANWQLLAGISYNHDIEQIDIDNDRVETFEDNYQLRIKLTQTIFNSLAIKYGAETIISDYKQDYFVATEEYTYNTNFNENYLAAFIEPELQLSKHFALRPGTRLEYSKLSNEFFLQPRISLACRLTARSQFSFAFGKFSQAAQNDYRKFNNELKAERAKHYILNYQYVKNERTFRIEAYYKKYDNLIKYDSLNLPIKDTYNNNGNGFAKGIDIFWRDSKTFTNVDYYFSYSFMDTERNYRNYTEAAPPIYTSTHNFSAVYKHWVSKISSQIGLTYSFASGRPYYNPNNLNFMTDRTPPLHDVSVNLSHLTTFFDKPLIIHASVSNLLGYDKVYGYRYPVNPNDELYNEGHAVKPSAKRFFLLVFMLSL